MLNTKLYCFRNVQSPKVNLTVRKSQYLSHIVPFTLEYPKVLSHVKNWYVIAPASDMKCSSCLMVHRNPRQGYEARNWRIQYPAENPGGI